ncbi:peroxidase domain-containing protein, partial [Cephalotus follicularis]
TMDQIIKIFASKGFDIQEMVALVGAHTIGFSHCKEFSDRLFNYSKTSPVDPEYNPRYATSLQKPCKDYIKDPEMAAFNDVLTPNKFDNMYYQNLPRELGLLASDHAMVKDPRTKPFVQLYATNQTAFFKDFAHPLEKLKMVALVGAHTIGFSHCKEFSDRLFNYSKTSPVDPEYNPRYATSLQKPCKDYIKDPEMAAFNDVLTPNKFDNMYYQNLPRELGLLASDHAMVKDPRTKPFVQLYATNQTAFFKDFAHPLEKLSILETMT